MNALLNDRSLRLAWFRSSFTPLALLAALIIGPAIAGHVIDARTWAHVDLGETMLRLGHIPTGTQVGDGYRWMSDSHLAQVSLAIAHRMGGTAGLGILAFGVGFAFIATLAWMLEDERVGLLPTGVVLMCAGVLLAPWWKLVPNLFSLFWFTLMLGLLQYAFSGWQGKWHGTSPRHWFRSDWRPGQDQLRYESTRLKALWLAAPLFFIWANLNGAFRVGLAVFCAYLAGRAIEAICQRGWAGWGLVRRMSLMALVAMLATLINPYGPWLYGWLASPAGATQRTYLEGPTQLLWQPEFALVVGLLILAIAIAGWSLVHQRFDLARWLGLAVAAFAVWLEPKHLPFLVIAASAWLALPLSEWSRGFADRLALLLRPTINGIPWDLVPAGGPFRCSDAGPADSDSNSAGGSTASPNRDDS